MTKLRKKDGRCKTQGLTHSEHSVYRMIKTWENVKVMRDGWPDFLLQTDNGDLFAIEVKSGADPITLKQQQIHEALASYGIKTHIFRNGECVTLGIKLNQKASHV